MKEIISIHLGQAGLQAGSFCWQLYFLEHSISLDGQIYSDRSASSDNHIDTLTSFFSETDSNKYVPRSIFIDSEPTVIDEIRAGTYRQLFSSNQLISGKQDASSNFARGYYNIGPQIIDTCLDKIKKFAENCIDLEGFIIFNAVGGGTGSGFGSLLLEKLSADYEKKIKVGLPIYPHARLSPAIVEPYNSVLAAHSLLENTDISLLFDNEALFNFGKRLVDIEEPEYHDLNEFISLVVSSLTSSIRFSESRNSNLTDIIADLIPCPRARFVFSSYAPPPDRERSCHVYLSSLITATEMAKFAFDPEYTMAKCDPRHGRYMSCSLLYRGEFKSKEIDDCIVSLESNTSIKFLDWCSTGFKLGVSQHSPTFLPNIWNCRRKATVCLLSNSTAIAEVFSRINRQYDLMYAKKAFVHWYTKEGMEESEFLEARQDLENLVTGYQEIDHETGDEKEDY